MVANASRVIDVIRQAISQETGNAAGIQYTPGVIETGGSEYLASAYIRVDEYLENIIVPSGMYLSAGDYAVIGISGEGRAWVDRLLPQTDYAKLVVDTNNARIAVGNGLAAASDWGQAGQSLLSGGPDSSAYWGFGLGAYGQETLVMSGTVNDYAVGNITHLKVDTNGADRTLTGISGGTPGRVLIIHNIGTGGNILTLAKDSTLSQEANRFGAVDPEEIISDGGFVVVLYDGAISKWLVFVGPPNAGEDGDMAPAWNWGDTNDAAKSGEGIIGSEYALIGHRHAAPANPVTAHEAASDPHTGYLRESVVQGLGGAAPAALGAVADAGPDFGWASRELHVHLDPTIAHAAAADPHTGYLQESVISGLATPAIVLGTSAAAGSGTTPIRHNSTIAAFDATNPATLVPGSSAVVGSAAFAARRDHQHPVSMTRCILAKVANQTISTASNTTIVFASGDVVSDPDSLFSDAGDSIIVNATGLWIVSCTATWDSNTTGLRRLWVRVGGADWAFDQISPTAASSISTVSTSARQLTSGEAITFAVRQDSGANRILSPVYASVVRLT